MTPHNTRGGRLRKGRIKTGKTVEECASDAGVSSSTWRKWEYDQSEPRTITQLKKACEAAGITPSFYVSGNKCHADLTDQEIEILKIWRSLTPEGKQALSAVMGLIANKD